MRSLALLLILANTVLFAWQKSLLPWIPWQPSSFRNHNIEQPHSPPSGLTQLVLLSESNKGESETIQPVKNVDNVVIADAHNAQVLNTPNQNTSNTNPVNSSTDSTPANNVVEQPETVQNNANQNNNSQIVDNTNKNMTTPQSEKQSVFFNAFVNLYMRFISTTTFLLNVPINESGSENVIVKVGKDKYSAPSDSEILANSMQNTKIADTQKENTINIEKPIITNPIDSKEENNQKIDSSKDSSNSMIALTKDTPAPVENSEKFQNVEKNSKIEEVTGVIGNPSKNGESSDKSYIQLLCFETGPYVHPDTAKNVMDWFTKQKVNAKIQHRKTPILESIWVYLPPFKSNAAALQMQQRLTESGIQGHSLATWRKNANIVSLGLYRDPVNAELRIKELRDKGYSDVRFEKVYKSDKRYWLNIKISPDQSPLIDSFRKDFNAYTSLQAITCD